MIPTNYAAVGSENGLGKLKMGLAGFPDKKPPRFLTFRAADACTLRRRDPITEVIAKRITPRSPKWR